LQRRSHRWPAPLLHLKLARPLPNDEIFTVVFFFFDLFASARGK
jgi:hypothetical protein